MRIWWEIIVGLMILLKQTSGKHIAGILNLHLTALQYQREARQKMFESIRTVFMKAIYKQKSDGKLVIFQSILTFL